MEVAYKKWNQIPLDPEVKLGPSRTHKLTVYSPFSLIETRENVNWKGNEPGEKSHALNVDGVVKFNIILKFLLSYGKYRLKVRCDKKVRYASPPCTTYPPFLIEHKVPCTSCVRRGCPTICPNGKL